MLIHPSIKLLPSFYALSLFQFLPLQTDLQQFYDLFAQKSLKVGLNFILFFLQRLSCDCFAHSHTAPKLGTNIS